MVIVVTNLSASIGGITWALIDYQRNKTFSALSFCFGAVAGLVSVTPASGYIRPASAVAFGIIGPLACRLAVDLKDRLGIDDVLDVVNVHGVGGLVGTLLTGIFAEGEIAALDGVTVKRGGWLDGNWILILYQLADCVAGMLWSFFVTYAILWVMNKTPGLKLRVDDTVARQGMDKAEMGESAYQRINNDPNQTED
jgi:Amt family ammonium transporter